MKHIIGSMLLLLPMLAFANAGYERVEALDDRVKMIILFRAIEAHDLACQSIVKSIPQGQDDKGIGYWTVLCNEGESYSVRVNNDDEAGIHVTLCGEVHKSRMSCAEDATSVAVEN